MKVGHKMREQQEERTAAMQVIARNDLRRRLRMKTSMQALLERQACCARPQRECDRPSDEMEEEGGLAAMSKRSSLIIAA